MVKTPEEVSFLGLYDEDGSHQNQFTMTETLMGTLNKAMDNSRTIEPMVWMINKSKTIHTLYTNALPIHRKVYDVSNMLVYKTYVNNEYTPNRRLRTGKG